MNRFYGRHSSIRNWRGNVKSIFFGIALIPFWLPCRWYRDCHLGRLLSSGAYLAKSDLIDDARDDRSTINATAAQETKKRKDNVLQRSIHCEICRRRWWWEMFSVLLWISSTSSVYNFMSYSVRFIDWILGHLNGRMQISLGERLVILSIPIPKLDRPHTKAH